MGTDHREACCEDGVGEGFGTMEGFAHKRQAYLSGTKALTLAELAAVSNLFGCLLQKFLNMLVRLRLQPRLCFDPVRYLNCSVHSDVLVELPSPMQVGFNQDEFLGRDLCQARSGRHSFVGGTPRRPDVFECASDRVSVLREVSCREAFPIKG